MKNETGRSMVEMLGVLAIVGVLSIGAISGYTYAMSKHRANEILNGISMMAISASQQIALRRDFSLAEFKDEGASGLYINGSYPVTDEKYDDGTFELTVSGVPKDACDRLVSMDWKQPKEILVNDGAGCQKGDNNVLAFTFYDDLDNQGKDQSDTPADDDDDTSDNTDVTDTTEATDSITACDNFTPMECVTACQKVNGVEQYTYAPSGTICNKEGWGGLTVSSASPSFLTPKAVKYVCNGTGSCCPSGRACGGSGR